MMSLSQPTASIPITPMLQLAEAREKEDDWTGLTDAASRRRRQTRLNTRAYRRRKALKSKSSPVSASTSETELSKVETEIPCWVEDQQSISIFPASVARTFNSTRKPLIPSHPVPPGSPAAIGRIIFPLSSDHLITLVQFNALRAGIVNRLLVSDYLQLSPPTAECTSSAIRIFPPDPAPISIPPAFHPTLIQRTIPHEQWIDVIPHPGWRDNLILAAGTFDEDDLWSDTIGGLFEGFPASEIEHRGVIVWSPPWHCSGWELSEGFYRKWGWSIRGCDDLLEATNKWRRTRGENPLSPLLLKE